MSAEDAHRIFERFYRTDSSRDRASGGTGLGLSIVDSLVYAHGGTVSVTTAPGMGCRFTVNLPRIADVAAHASEQLGHGAHRLRRHAKSASAALIFACASSSDSCDGSRIDVGEPEIGEVVGGEDVHVQMRDL